MSETKRTYGITLASVTDAQDQYAAEISKTREELSETEKIQAVLNAVLAQGGQIAGAYEAAMDEVLNEYYNWMAEGCAGTENEWESWAARAVTDLQEKDMRISHLETALDDARARLEENEIENERMGVVVTTKERGVFFGYVSPEDRPKRSIRVEQCRMCISWAVSNHGVVGLAADGPNNEAKVTPAALAITLHDVTSVMECGDKAIKAWELEPWN